MDIHPIRNDRDHARTDRSSANGAKECADRIGATSLPGDLVAGPCDTVARGQGGGRLARTPGRLRRETGQSWSAHAGMDSITHLCYSSDGFRPVREGA